MLYFTSDLHFGSDDILWREDRPFNSIKEFQDYCFNLWNKDLCEDDILYVIGDYCNYSTTSSISYEKVVETYKTVSMLNCKVILIIGNNEQRIIDKFFNGNFDVFKQLLIGFGFKNVFTEAYVEIRGDKFYLNHFPSKHKDGYINLFGHTHRATGIWKPFGLNVCCDLNHFRLYDEDHLFKLLKMKVEWWDKCKECATSMVAGSRGA